MSEIMEKMAGKTGGKPEVRINGKLYRLRFDLGALEEIEAEYGGVREAFKALTGAGMTKAVRKLFKSCFRIWI